MATVDGAPTNLHPKPPSGPTTVLPAGAFPPAGGFLLQTLAEGLRFEGVDALLTRPASCGSRPTSTSTPCPTTRTT